MRACECARARTCMLAPSICQSSIQLCTFHPERRLLLLIRMISSLHVYICVYVYVRTDMRICEAGERARERGHFHENRVTVLLYINTFIDRIQRCKTSAASHYRLQDANLKRNISPTDGLLR